MFQTENIYELVDSSIKKVWFEDIKRDYENHYLLKEDTLKNSFYYYLRMRLGELNLEENNIRIFTEYKIKDKKIDLAVVEIDPLKAQDTFLGDCVNKVIAVVEMKYKSSSVNASYFSDDVKKIIAYFDDNDIQSRYYLAFIWEKYFKSTDIVKWLDDDQAILAKGKLLELYAVGDLDKGCMDWKINEY